jgi:hypothetical protein
LWVIQGGWVNAIRAEVPTIGTTITRPPAVTLGAVPNGHGAMTSFAWPSYRRFARTLADSSYWFRGFTSVMYDPEGWSATPQAERRHPIEYARRFATLARAHGWTTIVTPAPNLASVPGSACRAGPDEQQDHAYIRCNVTGRIAYHADMVEAQAQHLEASSSAYRDFVARTAAQARDANPQVKVIAGLTTGRSFTPAQMFAAWSSVRNIVDGYYLSISGNERWQTARDFLRMLPPAP